MSDPRAIRRLAFQLLYQIDAVGGGDATAMADRADAGDPLSPGDRAKAASLASGAYDQREQADTLVAQLAPDWPTHRQPAVDRAIIRLAFFEMDQGRTPPKVVVSEAVRLAKAFSTEKSPAFVNAILDKILKRHQRAEADRNAAASSEQEAG
ncbi:MAG: transcription antitermination factor NusB [Planctomycetota bacterium]